MLTLLKYIAGMLGNAKNVNIKIDTDGDSKASATLTLNIGESLDELIQKLEK